MDINTLTTFLGWCSVINIALLTLSTLALMGLRKAIATIHARMFGVESSALPIVYMQYLAHYKILILVFNLVPYIALKLVF